MYNFKEIEKKWQEKWENEKRFKAVDFHPTKPKYYVLYEFFNISGNLHMGHLKGTVPADALARYKRFSGFNVLFPIGGDSFGLPAENAAIKNNINPVDFVNDGMNKAMDQSKKIGLSFDYSRSFATSDEDYYKWTQWIFLQLLKHNKAYKKKGVVNFCPTCKTVLSNEDSQNGICDRCGSKVKQEERNVWFLKMKEYSEKLLKNIENIEMSEYLKESQRNWIGKSIGHDITFDIIDQDENTLFKVPVYTTCIETIFGVTFLSSAPENDFIDKYKDIISNYQELIDYRNESLYKNNLERISESKNKTGIKIEGLRAVNPVNNKIVPIYASDYVISSYGSGVVMGVPTHDKRDFEFAKKFNIPSIQVIEGNLEDGAIEKKEYLKNNSKLINSNDFSGLTVNEAKSSLENYLSNKNSCSKKINYKMQDWSFNRQRYWGEPFPVVFCEDCGTVPCDEKTLPITLPHITDYLPTDDGSSPLAKEKNWYNTKCPKCGENSVRETDTMPNWAGSSWYWLRYVDPHNKNELANFEKLKYWGSVDCYTGGTEHITRHVLYAFFWQNFLYEIGIAPTRNPFTKKMGSGLILDDTGKKMSKSSTNGVSPMTVINEYGTDAARLHVHFLGGYEDNTPWTYKGINGIVNFLNRVWSLQDIVIEIDINNKHLVSTHKLIKKISEDIENLKLNTAIASCMAYVNEIKKDNYITKKELSIFLVLLNPLAPHITSELYEIIFNDDILNQSWPTYDEDKLITDIINISIQINGKFKKNIQIEDDDSENKIISKIKYQYPNLIKDDIKKIIYIKNKTINIVI